MVFEKTVLANGITIYGKRTDDPFVLARIYLPVGHAHNTAGAVPGTAHFLEHMACGRSEAFPEHDGFSSFVHSKGGYDNAYTFDFQTSFVLGIPSVAFKSAFRGLVSSAFEPLLLSGDIPNEVSVIKNERNRKSIWWPGENELGLYCNTEWRNMLTVSQSQIMGSDDDLFSMTAPDLRKFHARYFDPRVSVILVGSYDLDFVACELSQYQTQLQVSEVAYSPIHWVKRDYHEILLGEDLQYRYTVGGILESRDTKVFSALILIFSLLTSSPGGRLYEWLRKELGWSYGVKMDLTIGGQGEQTTWQLDLPVTTYEQSQAVRRELHGKILEAISNDGVIASEQRRIQLENVFRCQSAFDVMDRAGFELDSFGKIISEAEDAETSRDSANSNFLRTVYEEFMSPCVTGEILVMPKEN